MTDKDLDRWRGYAYSTAQAMGLSHHDCQDAAQDAVVEIIIAQPDQDALTKEIVRNTIRTAAARVRRMNSYETPTSPLRFDFSRRFDDMRDDQIDAQTTFDQLNNIDQVILLSHLYGHTDREIAAELDMSENAVCIRRHRVRQRFLMNAI